MKQGLAIFVLLCCTYFSYAQNSKQLRQEASAECEKGNFSKAVELSEKAIVAASVDAKVNKEDQLILRSENASYYLLSEQIDKGFNLFTILQEEAAGGRYPLAEMNISQNYGIALVFLGFYADALPQLQKALELSKSQPMELKDRVSNLGSLAVCYQYEYDFIKAEELFKEAVRLCQKENLTNTVDYASLQSNFALLYRDMQVPIKANTCYEEAEKIFKRTKDTVNPQYPVFLMEYGSMLAEAYQFERALSYTFKAKNMDKFLYTENSSAYAGDLNNLGFIYSKMNKIVETEQYYTSALKIKKALPFVRLESYLTTLSNLIVFYCNVGREAEAKELVPEIEEGLKNKNFTDTLKRATFANNLGIHFKEWGDMDKSIKYFKEALKYYEAIYGPDNLFMAEVYVDMATSYFSVEKYEDVADYLNKAAGVYSKTKLEENVGSIDMICNLAVILKEVNNAKEAESYVNKTLDIVRKYKVTQPELLERVYLTKAEVAADLNKVKDAMEYFNKYLDLKYSQVEQNFSFMTENEKLFFLEEFENNIRNFYTTILNHMEDYPELIKTLLDFRLKTKSLLLNNLSKIRQAISETNDPLLATKFEDLKLKRETIAKLMSFNTSDYPNALSEATQLKVEADGLEKEISLKVSASFGWDFFTKSNWKSIQKLLSPGEAAIEVFQSYLVYNNNQGKGTNYTFLVIKPTGEPLALSIDRPIQWEEEVMISYRKSIESQKNDPELYRRLWKFVDDKMGEYGTFYISPDGIYNQVNLNTLYDGEKNKFLIEQKNIHLLTSLNDLEYIKRNEIKKPQNCVLVGNPRFDFDLSKLNAKNQTQDALATRGAFGFVLSELPGTKEEVKMIKATLDKSVIKTTLLTEENANEGAVKKIKNPDVLHLATHGFFLEDPKDEDLAGYEKMEQEYYKNPMMRSGVFFSGANKDYALNTSNASSISEVEDGMLTAYEAMNLSLDKTELVVLSACQTGLGKVRNGEGVYGLQRAFKLAGAKSVIMSLWPVSDEATKDLMISFYDSWAKSGNIYEAFKQAQLDVKKKYPEPYYWGAFVLNGK